ncbi:hypothetical protein U9M48_015802 [Paspalum notatum var. saurae]|uniref:Histone deacetylase domain-containing protein n=1 Tax=Paspalum notatum var. saurae TaxID=547442 RepID=A0AAQ3WM42_PASNO
MSRCHSPRNVSRSGSRLNPSPLASAAPPGPRRALAMALPRVGLLYDERMCAHAAPDGEDHPENPERLRAIWRKLNAEGVASRCVVLKAKEAEDKYIAAVHSQSHVIKLMKEISSKKYDARRNKIAARLKSIYFNKGSSESAVPAAGSVIDVAEKVAAGELTSAIALVRPPGHHAEHDQAMGFCLFHNVVVAANYLLNERPDLGIKKILIVDWDVHHGNAAQKMFYNDPRVLFFSFHRFDYGSFYPGQVDASHCFIGEEAAFDPDIIMVSAGFDAALGDPLGDCCITPNGYALLLTKVRDKLKTCWPVLNSKLPQNVSLRIKPSLSEVYLPLFFICHIRDFMDLGACLAYA